MNPYVVLYIFIGAFVLFAILMIVRAVLTRPQKTENTDYHHVDVDKERVASELSGAVQIETVTLQDDNANGEKFLRYQSYLEDSFPLVAAAAEKTNVNRYAAIYVVKGSEESLLPIAILAHQDVVPAPPEGWEVPPFSGAIKDNCVYGRGSQDMKSQMIAALHALEVLLEKGFTPRRTIYFCFGHDEELKGTEGALQISQYLKNKGIRFELVIDEGGTIIDGSILGIQNKLALIGTCEKGYADVILEVEKTGGHASTPTSKTAVGILSKAVAKLERRKPSATWTKPTKELIKTVSPYMNPLFKFIFVNRDVLSPALKYVFTVASPFTSCIVRTTMAPTQITGSDAPNVLPPRATANINCRLNTGTSAEDARKYIQKVVGKNVKVTLADGYHDPSPVSDTTSDAYKLLTKTISEVFNGFVVAPYPFIAASDAKYYYDLSNNVYRFTPFEKTMDDAARIHALNERQNIDELGRGTEFFMRLLQNFCA